MLAALSHRPGAAAALCVLAGLTCALAPLACTGGTSADPGGRGGTAGDARGVGDAGSRGEGGQGGAFGGSSGTIAVTGIAGAGNAGAPGGAGPVVAGRGGGGSAGTAGRGAGGAAGIAGDNASAGSSGAWNSAFPTFTRRTIASFSSGYALVVADVDHDGLPDVVALSSASDGLVWFKNPSWKKYTITTRAKKLIYTAPYDVDGDGHLDVAFVSDFDMNDTAAGGTVSWAEAPADPTQSQDWTLHKIGAIPTSHRLRWADLDGDGRKELLDLPIFGVGSSAPSHAGAVQLTAFFIPKDPKAANATWTAKIIDDSHLETAHGLEIVDWDGDKAADILTAANDGVDLFRPSLGKSVEHLGAGASGQAPDKGSSEVGLGSLGGARFIATIEPWHGTDGVIYTPGASASELWKRQVLGKDFEHGHGLVVADLNGDGYDEVIAGGGQGAMTELIYRYVPSSGTWEKIKLDTGAVAVSGIDVADMNGDGALDIVVIGGSPTNNVVWYESTR
jgi:hypothetical protein